jgi:ketosteroid isomerase-like protein
MPSNADLKEKVRTYYERYAAHDLDGVLDLMDEEIRIYFPIDDQPKVGKDQIRKTWRLSWNSVIPDIHPEVHDILVDGNRAAVQFTETGTVYIPEETMGQLGRAAAGRPYSNEIGSFFRFSDGGLIKEIRSYWDTGSYAKQLGIDIGVIQEMSAKATSSHS